jgi:uncharacterized protein with WD repeat
MKLDQPIDLDQQAELMKKYIVFKRKTRVKKLLVYTGYFRLSRYGKYLISSNQNQIKIYCLRHMILMLNYEDCFLIM